MKPLWMRMFAGFFWFFVGLFIGLAICNSRSQEWKTTDKVLLGTYAAASLADAMQTDAGIKSGKYIETNPVFGEHPSTARIYLTKAAFGGLIYWLADSFPENRRTILWIANGLQIGVVAHNASIGMKVKF